MKDLVHSTLPALMKDRYHTNLPSPYRSIARKVFPPQIEDPLPDFSNIDEKVLSL